MTDALIRPLRDVAHALKTDRSVPESIDVGALCWNAADALEDMCPDMKGHDALEGAVERAEGRNAQLMAGIGMLLPLARRFAQVPLEHGGPDQDELVSDDFGDGSRVHQEVIDAQSLLETGAPELATGLDAAQFLQEDFFDTDMEPLIASTTVGDTVETALSHAHGLLARRNALRIVRSEPNAQLDNEYEETLKVLFMRLQEQLSNSLD